MMQGGQLCCSDAGSCILTVTNLNLTFYSAIEESWTAPFLGHWQDVLANNLRKMYCRSLELGHTIYITHTTLIQSSGSGKSRLVDEVARTIFTIPCNIRDVEDERCMYLILHSHSVIVLTLWAADGAWPPSDSDIRNLLLGLGERTDEHVVRCRYLLFFQALFRCTDEALDACLEEFSPQERTTAHSRRAGATTFRATGARIARRYTSVLQATRCASVFEFIQCSSVLTIIV